MRRRGIAALLILVWLVALGLLARRTLWHPAGQQFADAALSLPPGATYFAVELGDAQVGYASSTVDTLIDTLRVLENVVLEIPVLGELQRTEARTEILLTRTLRLRDFSATLRGMETKFTATGHVEGDSTLTLTLEGDESRSVRRIPITEPIVLPQLIPLRVAFGGGLAVGRTFTVRLFDPLLLESRDANIEVAAESTFVVPQDTAVFDSTIGRWRLVAWDTLRAWRIREAGGKGVVDTWIDRLGQLVAARAPGGFRLVRTAHEVAYENYRIDARDRTLPPATDLVRSTAIASHVRLVPERLAALTIRLTGQSLDGLDLDGGRQRRSGDTIFIRREVPTRLTGGYRLPDAGAELTPFQQPEPLIQSDDPRIAAQARQIIGNTRRPERAAQRINQWVYDNLRKEVTVGVPSALDVYLRRSGDCNEHTVLYVALARAVGLPARTVAGLVYLDGTFYYHAWPEVWLGGEWVAVDPTFGQFPADAAHVRLAAGSLARQLELVPLVGRIGVDVLATEPAS
jgi:transglutaminase-like putative cysteine protease